MRGGEMETCVILIYFSIAFAHSPPNITHFTLAERRHLGTITFHTKTWSKKTTSSIRQVVASYGQLAHAQSIMHLVACTTADSRSRIVEMMYVWHVRKKLFANNA